MSEEKFQKLKKKKKLFEDQIKLRTKALKQIEFEIDHFDVYSWWHSTMCHNWDECGDECGDCDMPDEMWDNRKRELEKDWEGKI